MSTEVIVIESHAPDPRALDRAARIVRGGGLVAFPTETVYGLGANALDAEAVRRLFAAKGRPARNPVIVHVASIAGARRLVAEWPENAQRLAERFWPGPLSLVLPKSETVPDAVTAGGRTVALRVPGHPVALALLEACALPLAGPSANRSSELSPTRAEHVLRSLDGMVDVILDAGPTAGGIESTVVDLATEPARLLRPGLVSRAELEEVLGPIATLGDQVEDAPLRSPGLLTRHYAPRTPLELAAGTGEERVRELVALGMRVGWLQGEAVESVQGEPRPIVRRLPDSPAGYAAVLYATLHELDALQLDRIVVAALPDTEEWCAVRDRLRRAASPSAPR